MEGYPNTKFRYWLEVDGFFAGGFMEVSGMEVPDDRIGGLDSGPAFVAAMEGLSKTSAFRRHGSILLKKGVVEGRVLYDWLASGIAGEVQPKAVSIRLVKGRREVRASWKILRAWPTKYTAPDFDAVSGWIAVDTLELAHEGVSRDDDL